MDDHGFKKGMIIAFLGSKDDVPDGWDPCDGSVAGVPNLNGLFLIGTSTWANVNKATGSAAHQHSYSGITPKLRDSAGSGSKTDDYYVGQPGNPPSCTGLDHQHYYSGSTDAVTWTPPSLQVMYIMKQ